MELKVKEIEKKNVSGFVLIVPFMELKGFTHVGVIGLLNVLIVPFMELKVFIGKKRPRTYLVLIVPFMELKEDRAVLSFLVHRS